MSDNMQRRSSDEQLGRMEAQIEEIHRLLFNGFSTRMEKVEKFVDNYPSMRVNTCPVIKDGKYRSEVRRTRLALLISTCSVVVAVGAVIFTCLG